MRTVSPGAAVPGAARSRPGKQSVSRVAAETVTDPTTAAATRITTHRPTDQPRGSNLRRDGIRSVSRWPGHHVDQLDVLGRQAVTARHATQAAAHPGQEVATYPPDVLHDVVAARAARGDVERDLPPPGVAA